MSAELAVLTQVNNRLRGVKNIVNAYSTSGFAMNSTLTVNSNSVPAITSGALTAGTLNTILDISGCGTLENIALSMATTTSKTIRLKVTIDGVVAFDSTSAASTTLSAGFSLPAYNSATGFFNKQEINFVNSLLVEYASSISETGGITIRYSYTLR